MTQRKMNDEIVCPMCGRTFPLDRSNRIYCSTECKRASKRAAEAARVRRMRERAEHKSSVPSPLSAIAREANAAGMTYGRYVAQKAACASAESWKGKPYAHFRKTRHRVLNKEHDPT